MTILEARERDAKEKLAWFRGETDRHPHGLSNARWVIPYEWSRKMNDGGEWAQAAGFE